VTSCELEQSAHAKTQLMRRVSRCFCGFDVIVFRSCISKLLPVDVVSAVQHNSSDEPLS